MKISEVINTLEKMIKLTGMVNNMVDEDILGKLEDYVYPVADPNNTYWESLLTPSFAQRIEDIDQDLRATYNVLNNYLKEHPDMDNMLEEENYSEWDEYSDNRWRKSQEEVDTDYFEKALKKHYDDSLIKGVEPRIKFK